jgi:hypothetical protein
MHASLSSSSHLITYLGRFLTFNFDLMAGVPQLLISQTPTL